MKRTKGFTLVELLVVISIIAVLLSILMPSLRAAREQARLVICKARQSQNGLANLMYADGNNGKTINCVERLNNGDLDFGVCKDMRSIVCDHGTYHRLGKLFGAGIIDKSRKSAQIFYCPSVPKNYSHSADYVDTRIAPGDYGYGMTNLDRIMFKNWPWNTYINVGCQVRNKWANPIWPPPGGSIGRKKLESMSGKWSFDLAAESRKAFISDPWAGYHNGRGTAWFLDGHIEGWMLRDMQKTFWYYDDIVVLQRDITISPAVYMSEFY